MMDNNNKGQLVVAHPPPQPTTIRNLLLFYGIVPILVPTFLTYKFVTDKPFRLSFPTTSLSLYYLVSSATIRPISKEWYFQDVALLQKLWRLPSARAYIDKDTELPLLEYQIREGYCGSATQRCILRSFGLCPDTLPPQKSGESKPKPWCEHIIQIAKEYSDDDDTKLELSTKIVRGNVGYDEFLSALREGLANDNVRVACNYLRSALTGFEKVRYFPSNLILAMLGGHFSPILGIIENDDSIEMREEVAEEEEETDNNNPFVAIFDTNHKYNGAYFVPARRLYEAVRAIDLTDNNHRAIVFVEKKRVQMPV